MCTLTFNCPVWPWPLRYGPGSRSLHIVSIRTFIPSYMVIHQYIYKKVIAQTRTVTDILQRLINYLITCLKAHWVRKEYVLTCLSQRVDFVLWWNTKLLFTQVVKRSAIVCQCECQHAKSCITVQQWIRLFPTQNIVLFFIDAYW